MPTPAKRWQLHPAAPTAFLQSSPEHPLLLQVLYNRGLRTSREVAAFLNGPDAVQENPYRLRDMPQAVQRILQALETGETICVYGDFDADGVSATALLVDALQAAGAQVGAYIPDRVDEGYGLNPEAIQQLAGKAQLLITVDCGIRSLEEVALANRLGLDVIVTDHHSVGAELPPALAVVNPQRADCTSGFQRLAGVGVAYRLAQAILRATSQQPWSALVPDQVAELEASLLDLVAIGTVADMMPLTGENRSLVQRGLEKLQETQRPGLGSLFQHASLRPQAVDSTAISFRIAPRINAAGRLEHAKLAYELLRTSDPGRAHALASHLEELNQRRQKLTAEAQELAQAQMAESGQPGPILVASSPDFLPGIVGLVAGRLASQFYRPAVVIEEGPEESRGSARSIPEFHITQALDQVRHLLVRHGGHSRAAGFTLRTERLPELREALAAIAQEALKDHPDLRPTLWLDAEVALGELTWALQEQLTRLEPTGEGNSPPLFLARGCRVRRLRGVGQGKHLKLTVDAGPGSPALDAIAFHQGAWRSELGPGSRVDLAFQLEVNEWQGRRTLQLNVQDLRPSE